MTENYFYNCDAKRILGHENTTSVCCKFSRKITQTVQLQGEQGVQTEKGKIYAAGAHFGNILYSGVKKNVITLTKIKFSDCNIYFSFFFLRYTFEIQKKREYGFHARTIFFGKKYFLLPQKAVEEN